MNNSSFTAHWLNHEEIAHRLELRPKPGGKGYVGCCPVHGGDNRNGFTMVDKRDGTPAFTCHTAGCDWSEILRYLRDLGIVTYGKPDGAPARREYRSAPKPKPPVFQPIAEHSTQAQAEGLALWDRSIQQIDAIYAHPYSQAKGIPCWHYGARIGEYRGTPSIVIPMFSFPAWQICGVQVITGKQDDRGKWVKRTLGPTGLGRIGRGKGLPLMVVEGWADGVTAYEAAAGQLTVLIAFGQPARVAKNLDLFFGGKRTINIMKDAE